MIRAKLAGCKNEDDVRRVFAGVGVAAKREDDSAWAVVKAIELALGTK
jgi:hypothetical protein